MRSSSDHRSRHRKLGAFSVALVLLSATALLAAGCTKPEPPKPDYGEIMREIGSRYKDLYIAAQEDKWEFADYQAKKIRLLIEKSAAVNPPAAKDTTEFLEGAYPAILDGVQTKDKEEFDKAYGSFNSYCNACHSAQNVGYLSLEIPSVPDSPILKGGGGGDGEKKDEGGGGGPDKAAVEKTCTACHDTARIKAAAYTSADDWKALVERMKTKGAGVDDVEAYAGFLEKSKGLKEDGGGGGEVGGGGGAVDKAAAEKACTDCHGIDQIKAAAYASADEWKALVERMKTKGAPVDDVEAFATFLNDSQGFKK